MQPNRRLQLHRGQPCLWPPDKGKGLATWSPPLTHSPPPSPTSTASSLPRGNHGCSGAELLGVSHVGPPLPALRSAALKASGMAALRQPDGSSPPTGSAAGGRGGARISSRRNWPGARSYGLRAVGGTCSLIVLLTCWPVGLGAEGPLRTGAGCGAPRGSLAEVGGPRPPLCQRSEGGHRP